MNQESIIQEALLVHTAGKEPEHSPEVYEAAILAVARLDQKASENIAQAVSRVARDGDPEVMALMFAADRVRDREAAVGKSAAAAAAPSPVAEDAERVRKSGSSPQYTRDDYEDEMLSLSKQLARPGEDTVSAFARLAGSGHFDALYAAGELADVRELESAMLKGVSRDERFDRLLLDMASMRRAPGETLEKCAARLLLEDATIRDAYAAVHGA